MNGFYREQESVPQSQIRTNPGDLLRSSPFQAAISGLAVFLYCVAAVVLGALFWGILDIFAEMFRG